MAEAEMFELFSKESTKHSHLWSAMLFFWAHPQKDGAFKNSFRYVRGNVQKIAF